MENNKLCYAANFKPTNRHFKRLMESEARHLDRILKVVERNFVRDLLGENNISYSDLYKLYHGRFKQALKLAIETVQPKYITVNPKYFFEMYAQSKPAPGIGWFKAIVNWLKKLFHAKKEKEN